MIETLRSTIMLHVQKDETNCARLHNCQTPIEDLRMTLARARLSSALRTKLAK